MISFSSKRASWTTRSVQQPRLSCITRSLVTIPAVISAAAPNTTLNVVPPTTPKRIMNHYFDTFHIVSRLEAAGFQHGQAVASMKGIRARLVDATEIAKQEMLSKADLENQTYLFRAAISELKTEVQAMRKKESTQLRLDALGLQRQLELLDQRMREDLQTMRTEVEMDVEMRRSSTRSDSKDIELRIQELDNKFTVKLGDLRTEMERYKWDATRRLLLALVGLGVIGTYLINRPRSKPTSHGDGDDVDPLFGHDEHLENQTRPGNTFVSLG